MVGMGTIIPIATEYVEAGPKKPKRYKKKQKRYKKYSKAWWRQYRAVQRRKKALQARKRNLRLRQLRLARMRRAADPSKAKAVAKRVSKEKPASAVLPSGQAAPNGWKPGSSTPGEIQFRIDNGNGFEVGSAAISVVGPSMGDSVTTGKNLSLAGVPVTSLRREVINRMIKENGWVVNDYQKEVGGRTVYVVVGQSQSASGRVNARMFYFAEADGRIYSVATNASSDSAERLAEESEKVINSLAGRPRTTQQAAIRE